jgi:hypothetical protein
MEEGQVDEDLASRFIDHLEDQEMDDAASTSSIQAFARWGDRDNDKDNEMNVAGLSRQPFDFLSSRRVLFEEKEATMGPQLKKKLKKISFSIGGLASSSSQFNNIDQLDHIQVLLPPTSFKNVAVALPQDHSTCLTGYSDTVLYEYNNENDDLYCYLADFPLGGETDEEFARHHWMIDNGCTDHLSSFKDDFAHL